MSEDQQDEPVAVAFGHLERDLFFVTRMLRSRLTRESSPFYDIHGLASGEVVILCLIALNPGLSQTVLADAVVLRKSALTKIVIALEANGLIERRKSGEDLRVNSLHLTHAGRARHAAMMADMRALHDRVLAPLAKKEREQLFALLWRIVDGMGAPDEAD